ncbi:Uncharacterized protein HZ326_31822, partial [Fusarium oxysporum f. sp. albedinis]
AAVRPGSSIELHFRRQHQLKGQVLKDIKNYYGTLELADPKLTIKRVSRDRVGRIVNVLVKFEGRPENTIKNQLKINHGKR